MSVWLLILIVMSQPYVVERAEVLRTYLSEQACLDDHKKWIKQIPPNSNLGCVPLRGVSQT